MNKFLKIRMDIINLCNKINVKKMKTILNKPKD